MIISKIKMNLKRNNFLNLLKYDFLFCKISNIYFMTIINKLIINNYHYLIKTFLFNKENFYLRNLFS